MKVAVIGVGQLGAELVKALGDRAIPIYHGMTPPKFCDVKYRDMVYEALEAHQPDWVINTATSHSVDDLEELPNVAFHVNSCGAYNVAHVARELDIGVVYVSTNYVFGHFGPHRSSKYPRPLSVYGVSKLAAEHLTTTYAPRWLIVRTSTLFGKAGEYNFVKAMLEQKDEKEIEVTNNLIMSPSYAKDVAEAIVYCIEEDYSDYVEHIVNSGSCTYKELAEVIFKMIGADVEVKPCSASDRDVAVRPHDGRLVPTITMRTWQDALKAYLEEIDEIPSR